MNVFSQKRYIANEDLKKYFVQLKPFSVSHYLVLYNFDIKYTNKDGIEWPSN